MNSMTKKRIGIFLLVTFSLSGLTGILLGIINTHNNVADSLAMIVGSIVFMWFPTIAVLISIKTTKEDIGDFKIKLNLKGNTRYYLLACFTPGILIVLGTITYFILFPDNLDLSLSYAKSILPVGTELNMTLNIPLLILISLGTIVFSPLVIINHVLAFGEEFGWRGYLLPKLCEVMSLKKATILNGVLWGLAHAPLIYFGLHYGTDYSFFPILGILSMTLFTTTVGVFLSYLTIKTNSVIPASIAHGSINAIKGLPLFLAVPYTSTIIGPNPSSIIGGIGFIIFALVLYKKL